MALFVGQRGRLGQHPLDVIVQFRSGLFHADLHAENRKTNGSAPAKTAGQGLLDGNWLDQIFVKSVSNGITSILFFPDEIDRFFFESRPVLLAAFQDDRL
jgi:hypothetical protein